MAKPFQHGEPVRITGTVGGGDQGEQIGKQRARVLGVNPEFTSAQDGKTPMVNVELEDGRVAAVPVGTVKRRS